MRRPLSELLHDLANRMQAASSAAALLDPAAAANPSAEEPLRRLLNELQAAVAIVQTMCRELDAADETRERSA
jgi:hypothetical protein